MENITVAQLLIMAILVFGTLLEATMAAVYTVGDSAGWTTIGNVNYRQWAATKTFQIGDTIVFTYNKQFHNVMQVKHVDYRSCNASAPIATHSTGNDSFTVKTYGHHYFLCAVPGHCQAGQKVDINVQRVSSVSAPTPSTLPVSSPIPTNNASVPSPTAQSKASRPSFYFSTLSLGKLGLVIAFFAGVL